MGNVQFYNNKVLFVNNKVAMAPACCCEPDYSDRCPCGTVAKLFEYVTVTIPSVSPTSCNEYCALVPGPYLLPWTSCRGLGDTYEGYADNFILSEDVDVSLWYNRYVRSGYMREQLQMDIGAPYPCGSSVVWREDHYMDSCNAELPLTSLPLVFDSSTCGFSDPVTLVFPDVYQP